MVFVNRVPRRISKREEVISGKMHNEELHSLYALPNFVRVIRSRKMRWTGSVVRMEQMEIHAKF
jgi:hypothetical protein